MSENKKASVLGELHQVFFSKHWPVWVGGVILGLLNILLFTIKSPWGASGGINNWGENVYKSIGVLGLDGATPTSTSLYGMLCLLLVVGSFTGALLSKEFAFRIPPVGELIKGFIGGGLMAIGATIGLGCTIGSFFSGVPALSGGAVIFTIGLFLGVILALRYLLWEMERFPGFSTGKSFTYCAAKPGGGTWQKWLGWIIIALSVFLAVTYAKSNQAMVWYIIIGLLLGLICQRSRFCIVKAFRDPFMTGEADGSVGVMAGLLITLFGFTIIKYFGISSSGADLRAVEMSWVFGHFWARALLGGFIFGLGMTVAGGCAVGTLWRVGEGQVKLWASALGFLLISPLSKKFIVPTVEGWFPQTMKFKNFLPDYLGYGGAFALVIAIIFIW
ncbi:YeeE/YedE thiosulfate transporter family protein, partial [Bacteroidota bacterium]